MYIFICMRTVPDLAEKLEALFHIFQLQMFADQKRHFDESKLKISTALVAQRPYDLPSPTNHRSTPLHHTNCVKCYSKNLKKVYVSCTIISQRLLYFSGTYRTNNDYQLSFLNIHINVFQCRSLKKFNYSIQIQLINTRTHIMYVQYNKVNR